MIKVVIVLVVIMPLSDLGRLMISVDHDEFLFTFMHSNMGREAYANTPLNIFARRGRTAERWRNAIVSLMVNTNVNWWRYDSI